MSTLVSLEAAVLRKLAMLSEGGTLDLDRPSLHRVHPGSTAPPGVNELTANGAEDLDVSLYAYHKQRLEERQNSSYATRLMAIAEAERDRETSLRRPPAYIEPDSQQNSEDRDEAILRWEGKQAEWVAIFERCSASHVRKLRKLHKLKPNTGVPLEIPA